MDETEAPATGEAPSDRVAVILPDGRRGTVPRSSLAELPQGSQLEAPEATEARKSEQAQEGRTAQTFIESFADTATFGGTSAIARAIAPGEAQKMRQRREQNQGAAIVGTIAGGLTPGGVGGIIGKGGKAAAEVVAGTGAIRGLATGGRAAKAVSRYAPAIAQGAAEGALFGVGTGISNVALSKDPISAESAMSEITSSAILGLGIGAAAGLGGQFLSDSASLARAHVKRMTTPTIADDIIAMPRAVEVGGDTLRIAKGPGRANSAALRAEQKALESEAKGLVGRYDGPKAGTPADVPPGFVRPAGDEPIVHGLPSFKDADAARLYVVPARSLDDAGLHALPGGGDDVVRMDRVRGQLAEGKPVFDPLDVSMTSDGQLFVNDGRHRILAALEAGGDQPVLVRVSRAADGTLEGAVPIGSRAERGTPAAVIDDFKARYHKMDTASRQNIRQMEGLERKGIEISPELRQAADDLERARRATREWLPLEKERSYDVVDAGPRGGYANKQGKSLQSWTGTDEDIAAAVRKEGFRDTLLAHQEALDNMQALLGNKAYPRVIEDAHGIFSAPKVFAPAPYVPDAELVRRMEEVASKWDALEAAIAKQSAPERVAAFVKMAESKGMVASDDSLNASIKEAGLDGIGAADLPKAELDRLKAEIFQRQAKEQVAVAKAEQKAALDRAKAQKRAPEKQGGALSKLIGESLAEKAATGVGAAVGGAIGGPYGAMAGAWVGKSFLGGPLSRITGQVSGKVSGRVQRLADGVDAFLGATEKAAPKTVKLTNAVLKSASFAMERAPEAPAGKLLAARTPFDMRAEEMGRVMANPMAAQQAIHDSLAGVRLADPLLADQMEDLAFRRLLFLADKMPKNPGLGSLIGKASRYEPSDTEQAKWARYIDAAENPGDIVDSLTDGTLSAEAVEVMAELYPATYDRIQADIVARAGELQTELSWNQRLTLSTLFKKPTDSVLRPSNILSLQATFAVSEEEGQGAPSGGGMKAPAVTPGQKAAGA